MKSKLITSILILIILILSAQLFLEKKGDAGLNVVEKKEILQTETVSTVSMDELFIKNFKDIYGNEGEPKIITKGDINKDGFEDAIIEASYCGASCSFSFYIVLNKGNNSFDLLEDSVSDFENGITFSSAIKSSIDNVKIENGIIYISGYGLDMPSDDFSQEEWNTYKTIKFYVENDRVLRVR